MTMKLFDIQHENARIKAGFFERLSKLYDEGTFVLGYGDGPLQELERIFSDHCGRRFALGAGSGTLALQMAGAALGLSAGDEVIVPANTFVATASAPAFLGATIVAADVDDDTWNLSRRTVERVISPRTRAIFAVNMYGSPAPYDELGELGVPVVEDAAHSHGAEYLGRDGRLRKSGGLGDLSAFSFFPSKTFGGIGDSGMLLFDEHDWHERLAAYRNCGQTRKHYAEYPGTVARMDLIQALFLLEKWRVFPEMLERRRRLAAIYEERFRGTAVRTQRLLDGAKSGHFVYVVRVAAREKACRALDEAGIPWSIQYPYLLHQQSFWGRISSKAAEVPVAEKLVGEILTLPMNPGLTDSQVACVAETILRCAE